MRAAFTAAVIGLFGVLAFVTLIQGQDHIRITGLECFEKPEFVTIKNLSGAAQDSDRLEVA